MRIEPETFRLVAQCLNQFRQRVSRNITTELLLQTFPTFAIIKILITNTNGLQALNNFAKKTERERERERGAQYLQLAV